MNQTLLRRVGAAILLASLAAGFFGRGKRVPDAPATRPYVPPEVAREDPEAGEPKEPVGDLQAKEFRAEIERLVLRFTNEERVRKGVREVAWDAEAAKAARYQARCLAHHRLLGHDTVPCGSLRGRLDLFEIVFPGAENLDFIELPGPLDRTLLDGKLVSVPGGPPVERVLAKAIIRHWMASPHHRDNLLDRELTDLGVGVHWSEGRIYATQVFLRRVDCGVGGLVCCPGPEQVRYCYHPFACNVQTDVCGRPDPVPSPVP